MSIARKIQGRKHTLVTAEFYRDILPLLKEWTEQGIPQEEQAGLLNAMGKVNSVGRPYSQVVVCKVLKRAMELGQIDPPRV